VKIGARDEGNGNYNAPNKTVLLPDNKTRYPTRLKTFLHFLGLRIAAVEFVKITKQKPVCVEDKLMEFITRQHQRVKDGETKSRHPIEGLAGF
jgi:hypothetical protein